MKLLPVLATASLVVLCSAPAKIDVQRTPSTVSIEQDGRHVLTYNLQPPTNPASPIVSGAFFHPLKTPAGTVVTDLGPVDHKHHRGIFFGWIEMRGEKDADFWGWGRYAPIDERRIVNRQATATRHGFVAQNEWIAEGVVLIEELLEANLREHGGAHVLDLVFRLTPKSDLTLPRWNFGGFCFRGRAEGEIVIHAPSGPADWPNPSHQRPESAWPNAPWYALGQILPDGTRIGAAVMNHPSNPETLWHNHRKIAMINPCIVGKAPLTLVAGKPLVLSYRVVAFDGPVPTEKLNSLAREYSGQ